MNEFSVTTRVLLRFMLKTVAYNDLEKGSLKKIG